MATRPDLDLVHPPRRDDALAGPHMAYHGGPPLPFPRHRPPDRFFPDNFRPRGWNPDGSPAAGDDNAVEVVEDDEDDDDDEEDDDDELGGEGVGEVEGLVVGGELGGKSLPGDNGGGNGNNYNNSSGSVQSGAEKVIGEQRLDLQKDHHSSGSNRSLEKDGNILFPGGNIREVHREQQQRQGSMSNYDSNALSISNQDMYYSQMMQNSDMSALARKDAGGENGCGFSGRKDASHFFDLGDSLKAILSDPITGFLMDDAMILPCGHSFGNGGIQHILKNKLCYTCGHSIKEESLSPNFALRTAVQAFRRDEELQSSFRSCKKRRDNDQENGSYADCYPVDYSRGKGVQFPFVVADRVIIKGNKRTPQRFVGREAVVTTQCLNGWYVVKTMDNAESVKLQYRSLAKVPDNPSANGISSKAISSNWL